MPCGIIILALVVLLLTGPIGLLVMGVVGLFMLVKK